jgi:hypothetical protein
MHSREIFFISNRAKFLSAYFLQPFLMTSTIIATRFISNQRYRFGLGKDFCQLVLNKVTGNFRYYIRQCFSTFWASSSGWRQFLILQSWSEFLLSYCPFNVCFSHGFLLKKNDGDVGFAWITFPFILHWLNSLIEILFRVNFTKFKKFHKKNYANGRRRRICTGSRRIELDIIWE